MEILAEILMAVRNGARKTRIMYQANLSFTMLKKYLDYALEAKLIAVNTSFYLATTKGREFLEKYDRYSLQNRQVESMLKTLAKERAILNDYVTIADSGKNSFLKPR